MIGRLNIKPPEWSEDTVQTVDHMQQETRQGYAAIHTLGLWGSGDDNPRHRLFAGYQHVTANPEDGAQWLMLAHTHAELGETEKAENILREMMRVGGFDLFESLYQEDLRVNLAHVLALGKQYDEALELMLSTSETHSGHPLYHYTCGTLYHALERFEDALEEYNAATRELQEQRDAVEEEMDVDAILNVFLAERICAETGEPFDGRRPVTLDALVDAVSIEIEDEEAPEGL